MFAPIDDKHKIKVGEPGYPVSSVEQDREVIVSSNQTFVVGDHDFCKFSLIPNVIDIPFSINGTWYSGNVHIGIKDSTSAAIRHAIELKNCLLKYLVGEHVLFVYADGPLAQLFQCLAITHCSIPQLMS